MFPENADAARLFLACGTQWRFTALSGHLLGLDYAGAQAAARFMALKHSPDLFDKLRFMEAEARRLVNSDA